MELNKNKYTIFRNLSYALAGLRQVFRTENSFRIEVYICSFLFIAVLLAPIPLAQKAIMACSLFLPPIAELANTAIEYTVDMFTTEYNANAKADKDAGAAMVFLSICFTAAIWLFCIYSLIV
jgi:diacylglycerol kinase (ATP)